MLSRRSLLEAIAECEEGNDSYQNCQKLATLYTLYDHLYGEAVPTKETVQETLIDDYGDSDFLKTVSGKKAETVWSIIDETMSTLQAIQPRLYDAVLRKLKE